MINRILLSIIVLLTIPSPRPYAQSFPQNYPRDAEQLFALARNLWSPIELQQLGYLNDLSKPPSTTPPLRQACLFLEAAVEFDPSSALLWHDLTTLYAHDAINDPNRAADALFMSTSLNPEDQQVIKNWLIYRLDHLDDRESREDFLRQNLAGLSRYPLIHSQALMQLGFFALEQGIIEDAPVQPEQPQTLGARSYFGQAFNVSSYNDSALAQILMLPLPPPDSTGQLSAEQIAETEQQLQLEHELYAALRWRLRLRNNPYDLQAVLNLIDTLEGLGRYQLAQQYYPHAYTLSALASEFTSSLGEPAALRQQLKVKQLLGAYTGKIYTDSIVLAEELLRDDPDNFRFNVLLAKSLAQTQMDSRAEEIMQRLRTQTIGDLESADPEDYQRQRAAAWFFCFIDPRPGEALQMAQNAYLNQPNRRTVVTLAYAQLLNQQPFQAQALLEEGDPNDPITSLTAAGIAWARDEKDSAGQYLLQTEIALEGLRTTDPFQAAILHDHVVQLRRELLPETAAAALPEPDMVSDTFAAEFNGNDLLIVTAPEKVIRCALRFSTDVFQYGDPMIGQLFLSNISNLNNLYTDLVLGPEMLIDPQVVITAEIKPADDIPDRSGAAAVSPEPKPIILTHRYLLQKAVLQPGQSNTISEALNISQLRQILQDQPQQDYQITFRLYLDPVIDEKGRFSSKISSLQPNSVAVIRKAFTPTPARMDAVINAARSGTPLERINAIRLLAGLLREADLARRGHLSYRPLSVNTDYIRQLMGENFNHPDVRVRGWSAYALDRLSITADSAEASHLAQILSDSGDLNWFGRFMALYTLNPRADLTEYLQWAALTEKTPLLQRQVQLLQGLPWK